MAKLFELSNQILFDGSTPLTGGSLEFYQSGTNIALDTYSDSTLTTAQSNPLPLVEGRVPNSYLLGQDYKVILKKSDGTTVWTVEPWPGAIGTILDASGNEILEFGSVASAVNHWKLTNAATGSAPKAEALGDDTNIGADYQTKGTGAHTWKKGGGETVFEASGPASTVNNLHAKATATGASPSLDAEGADTNIGIAFNPKGTANLEPYGVSWATFFQGHIRGLILSNGTDTDHDIDISAGICVDGGNTWVLNLAAALTKQIDAVWAVGTDAGGLDTGAVANSTVYYVWLIKRSDTSVVDALFSTSSSSPTMPTNYDFKRLIGAVETDGSANIVNSQFMQVRQGRNTFVSANQTITSAGTVTLTHALGGEPDKVAAWLENTTGNAGYTAGQRVLPSYQQGDSNNIGRGVSVVPGASAIILRYGSDANTFAVPNATTGALIALTNSSWAAVVKAERYT